MADAFISHGLMDLAAEIYQWSNHNFGDAVACPPVIAVVGLGEECGEVQRALLKQHQGIRGTWDEWQAELTKELGDVLIKVIDVANRAGITMDTVLDRWNAIQQRDWKVDPLRGGQKNDAQ
jgi:NTP pyrophosphatase (non-canonical NTP hydrolase)